MPDLLAKLMFLRAPEAYGDAARPVQCIETHMSWVFLTGTQAFKLKKPVRFPFLDFTSLRAREFFCREEVRLNQRLAPGIYLGVKALQWDGARFHLADDGLRHPGETVDWLVMMRRLPSQRMLDQLILSHAPLVDDVDALAHTLGSFFQAASPAPITPADYLDRFAAEHASNRAMLLRPQFRLADAPRAFERVDAIRWRMADRLRQRVADHRVVEGHGDLRPEHICMLRPPLAIDCVEFSPALRYLDPLDELAFLALECDVLGDPATGRLLAAGALRVMGRPVDPDLMHFYTAHRALLRARLAVAHLLDAQPRTPQKWAPRAERYIALALAASADWFSAATRYGTPE